MTGMAFLAGSDQFINMCFTQIMLIPEYYPIFAREYANHMYTIHSYYFAVIAQVLTYVWLYPVLLSLTSFYCFGFVDHAASDLFTYMATLYCIALCGAMFGVTTGTMTSNGIVALLIGNFAIIIFMFGSGCIANTGEGMNPIVQVITWVSPMHYGIELLFKQITDDLNV